MNIKRAMALAGLLSTGILASAPAAALDLTCGGACPWVTYGDGNSFLLQYNAYLYDQVNGGGVGPGNPYYIDSTPGAIKDLTVIGTGTSSNPATTNTSGMDDAYPTPNSSGIPYFSTGTTADPNGANEFTGDGAGTWDVSLGALKSFMGTDNSLIFFFNNNQIKSGGAVNEGLAGWAQVTLRDAAGAVIGVFDLTNPGGKFATIADGGGGTLLGNPTAYTHAGALDNPLIGTNEATDYILSGGKQCLNAGGALVSCSDPTATQSFDANLGANQAAYAIVFPELDAQLMSLFAGDITNYSMNVNLRMGCDPGIGDQADCVGRSLNNGYEQVFLSTASNLKQVPEPGVLALLGIGMIGLWGGTLRRRG